MNNGLKASWSFLLLFFISVGTVQAGCIITTKNFSESSRVIYVNPINGSDQLAKIYDYNLSNLHNPYKPKQIVAFQSIDEALAVRNVKNGDLVLMRMGDNWTSYDAWSANKLAEFNSKNRQASGFTQQQCKDEGFTWLTTPVIPLASQQINQNTSTKIDTVANSKTVPVADTVSFTDVAEQYLTEPLQLTSLNTPEEGGRGSSSGGASSGFANTTSNSLNPNNSQAGNYSASEEFGNNQLANRTQPQESQLAKVESDYQDIPQKKHSESSISEGTLNNINEEGDAASNSVIDYDDKLIVDNINGTAESGVSDGAVAEHDGSAVEDHNYVSCNANVPWEKSIQTYPKDNNGWSIIKPDSESRIVYVSSTTGSDNYARPYMSGEISDPFNPPSDVRAYRTIEQAYAQLRDRKPDWLLLKKGDSFELQSTLRLKSGKSQSAHMVIGAYGDSNTPRPIIDSYTSTAISGNKVRSFITVSGIEFYASGRDPESSRFVGWDKVKGASGVSYVAGADSYGIHIENNRFSFYSGGIGMQGHAGKIKDIVIRRNQILNTYSATAHSQGMFLSKLDGAVIEENFLDHNGWYQQRPLNVMLNTKSYGYATYFNHNVYIENSSNLIIRKNLSSRPSSIGMKFASNSDSKTKVDTINSHNILLDSNLLVEGEVGFSIGGNTDFNNSYRWDNIKVINNVLSNVGRANPTNRGLGFNIEVNDWKTGSICFNSIVDRDNKSLTNVYGIETKGHLKSLTILDNQIINYGIEEEAYSKKENVNSHKNKYIPLRKNVNYLDNYVRSKGFVNYAAYIDSVRERLKRNPSDYYNVEEAQSYIKLQANY